MRLRIVILLVLVGVFFSAASCTGLSPIGGSTLTAPAVTDIRASLIAGNATCMAPLAWTAATLPPCVAENVTDVTYTLEGLPASLAFDTTTRTLSMAAGLTALPALTTAINVTYTCSGLDDIGEAISASQTLVLNDCDGGGDVDWHEFVNSAVPALMDDVGYVALTSLTVDTYLTPGAAPDRRKIRTNLDETTGMDVLNPADDSTTISAVSDIDGDGIANINDPNVFVAASTDTFVQTIYNNLNLPSSTLATDMNNDGFPDLLVGTAPAAVISVYLWNSATGTFNAPIDNALATPPQGLSSMTAADFNGDGNLDIIATSFNGAAPFFCTSMGDGNGNLTLNQTVVPILPVPWAVGVGDFNGDGFVDAAVVELLSGDVRVYLWNSALGQLVLDNVYDTGANTNDITMGDFNGDGFIDFATCNAAPNDVPVYLGDGTGEFTAAPGSPLPLANPAGTIVTADMDLDGNLDLVLGGAAVQIFYGNGDGTFGAANVYDAILFRDMIAADMDGDGDVDLAGVNGTFVTLLINSVAETGTVGFTQIISNVAFLTDAITAADFNGDNKVDLGFLTTKGGPPFPSVYSFIQQ